VRKGGDKEKEGGEAAREHDRSRGKGQERGPLRRGEKSVDEYKGELNLSQLENKDQRGALGVGKKKCR